METNNPKTSETPVGSSSDPESCRAKTPPGNPYTFGMLCHLLSLVALLGIPFGHILGPLVLWLVKRNEDPFVDACGKESLNFQITVTIAVAASAVLIIPIALIPFLGLIFVPALMFLIVGIVAAAVVLVIIASIQAGEGRSYRYPISLRFIR